MKKLFALFAAGSLLALTTGCPPAPTTAPAQAHVAGNLCGYHHWNCTKRP